jgi:hypothetical protein
MATRVLKRRSEELKKKLNKKKMVACFMSPGDHEDIKEAAKDYGVTITHILYQGMEKQLYWMKLEREYQEAKIDLPDTETYDIEKVMRDKLLGKMKKIGDKFIIKFIR